MPITIAAAVSNGNVCCGYSAPVGMATRQRKRQCRIRFAGVPQRHRYAYYGDDTRGICPGDLLLYPRSRYLVLDAIRHEPRGKHGFNYVLQIVRVPEDALPVDGGVIQPSVRL